MNKKYFENLVKNLYVSSKKFLVIKNDKMNLVIFSFLFMVIVSLVFSFNTSTKKKRLEDIDAFLSNNQTVLTAYDSLGSFNWNHDSTMIEYTFRNIHNRDNNSEPYVVNRIRYRQDVIGWLGDELNNISIYSLNDKKYITVPTT